MLVVCSSCGCQSQVFMSTCLLRADGNAKLLSSQKGEPDLAISHFGPNKLHTSGEAVRERVDDMRVLHDSKLGVGWLVSGAYFRGPARTTQAFLRPSLLLVSSAAGRRL